MSDNTVKKARQISIPTKIAYGMGQGMSSVKDMLFHFFFLFFFTNLLGVSEFLVVIASTIALVVDAISDPLMGQVTDNYRSKKWGRRHIFMLYSIIPTGFFLTLLFSPPHDLDTMGMFLWMTTFAVLVRLALTIFRVPYYSLGAELSDNYNERTNIVSVREIFNGLFNISVFVIGFTIFLPDSPQYEDGMMNRDGYAPLALAMAIIGCIGALIATYGTKHRIPHITKHHGDTPEAWWKMFSELRRAAKLKSFRVVTWTYSSMAVLYGVGGALSFYYGVYLWQMSQQSKVTFAAIPVLILIPATLLASVLAAKLDKREAGLIFATIFFIGSVVPYGAYLLGMLPPIGDAALFQSIVVCHAFASVGITGIIILCYSMLADVADEMELLTSKRQEGILYSALSFVQKLTFTLGTGIASVSLFLIDFPKQTEPSQVADSAINGLAVVGLTSALVFGSLTILCFIGYPLTRAKVASIQSKLRAARVADST
ncbi:MAG: GPH family glycoside/pentoside/hexuronide:cation symporter [Cryomorphaceae bacterium]|jgi:GPH family glycoside/pentoside/hexuronide:cation symporter